MINAKQLAALIALGGACYAPAARACGGFFCGQLPVDQTAERIVFEVGNESVTMTTQISFNGDAEDFAWILPLSEVPDVESLSVFPQRALSALDANTGPVFLWPEDPECSIAVPEAVDAAGGSDDGSVTVHVRAEVGDYDVAVIESEDPAALIEWLRTEAFRVTPPMEPYIKLYTDEGVKFLAVKLLPGADVSDIKPFRFTLPGTAPSIPLRMTSLAAEPEMSIVVFVLGDSRYEGKNWENLAIADDQIRFNPFSFTFPTQTNWTKLVAEAVDDAGGQGWVTEFAGSTDPYAEQVRMQVENGNFRTPEDEEAAVALLDMLEAHPYMTRLYTRLSAEEMTLDPVFGRSAEGDVDRQRKLSRYVNGVDQCARDQPMPSTDPCDFATCGAGGLCRPVETQDAAGNAVEGAGCACVPGATARTTFAPDGTATVICQDQRLSFLNPGDQEAGAETLSDPCASFDCGENGSCVPVNMTPTCVCDEGFVAIGSFDDAGQRTTSCVEPGEPVPSSFYQERLPDLPETMPGGRQVEVPEPEADPEPTDPADSGSAGSGAEPSDPTAGDPMDDGDTLPGTTDTSDSSADSSGGCSIRGAGGGSSSGLPLSLGLMVAWLAFRQRRGSGALKG